VTAPFAADLVAALLADCSAPFIASACVVRWLRWAAAPASRAVRPSRLCCLSPANSLRIPCSVSSRLDRRYSDRHRRAGRTTAIISLAGGVLMLLVILWSRIRSSAGTSAISVKLARVAMKFGPRAPLILGVSAALLPCGLLYAMVARSAAAENRWPA